MDILYHPCSTKGSSGLWVYWDGTGRSSAFLYLSRNDGGLKVSSLYLSRYSTVVGNQMVYSIILFYRT